MSSTACSPKSIGVASVSRPDGCCAIKLSEECRKVKSEAVKGTSYAKPLVSPYWVCG